MKVVTMDINASLFPAEVKATGDEKTRTSYKVDLRMDNSVIVHLKLEQARSLWHELGVVLQSLDHDAETIVNLAERTNDRWLAEHGNPHGINCPICTVEDPCISCAEQIRAEQDYAIRNLEDLRGLPHSSDLESHPSN